MGIIGGIFRAIIALVMIGGVLVAAVFIFTVTDFNFDFGSSAASGSGEAVMFTVEPGDTPSKVADNLQKAGLIDSPFWFRMQMKMQGAERDLKAGRFQIKRGMSADDLITALTTAPEDVGIRFTVIEGQRVGEIADKLAAEGIVDAAKFNALAGTVEGAATFSDEFLASSGKPADQGLEGYLFPDTYEVKQSEGDNSETVIRTMLTTMEERFTPEMRQRVAERQLTIHQVLTIASIVQREGQVKEELPTIASVFWNRVGAGMRLDADPTTQYAIAKSPEWWPNLDAVGVLPGDVDHPYNTYKIAGLPPGPIANPGFDAINAAVYPGETNYLYFVAKNNDTGEHAFAETLEEHEQNRVLWNNR